MYTTYAEVSFTWGIYAETQGGDRLMCSILGRSYQKDNNKIEGVTTQGGEVPEYKVPQIF